MSHLARLERSRRVASMVGGVAILLGVVGCTTTAGDFVVAKAETMPVSSSTAAQAAVLDLAEQALHEGRVDDARALLNRALPSTPRARLIAAELQLASGAYRSAAAAFHDLATTRDVMARALQGEGIALTLADHDPESGYTSLRAAVARDPTLWRAWNALGYYHDSRAEWRRAGESYSRALAIVPSSAMILNNRGFSMLMQGRIEEALANLGEALHRDPALRPARENLRLALAWDGQYALALAGTEDDGLARALNNVGYVALLRGDHEKSEALLLRAIEMDPAFNIVAARNLAYLRHLRDSKRIEGSLPPQ